MTIMLTVNDVAALLGMTPAALGALRRAGVGPPAYRYTPRSRCRYRLQDVAWWASGVGTRGTAALDAVLTAAVTQGIEDHHELRTIAATAARDAQERHDNQLLRVAGHGTRH